MNQDRYDESADIYSFGITLNQMDTLEQPYTHTHFNIVKVVQNGMRPIRVQERPDHLRWLDDLIIACFRPHGPMRPKAVDVCGVLTSNYHVRA